MFNKDKILSLIEENNRLLNLLLQADNTTPERRTKHLGKKEQRKIYFRSFLEDIKKKEDPVLCDYIEREFNKSNII